MDEKADEANEEEERANTLTLVLTKIVEQITAERVSLALLEDFFSPKPAKLAQSEAEAKSLEKRSSQIVRRFGGPPRVHLIIRANDGSDDGKVEHLTTILQQLWQKL
jgi:hypothetical protein